LWSLIVEPCYLASMNQREAISRLKKHEAELRALGVDHLYLFGSTARGEARPDSDVDLFFDHQKGRLGVYELIDVKERAARILGHPVDVMTRASLHPALKERIEKSAVLVF
jgi:predicted nucleotidyltransferase